MKRNPLTLLPESAEDSIIRQHITGEIGNGLTVSCAPNLEDPSVQEQRHRAVCLTRPYVACNFCNHASFTLVFKGDPETRYDLVACPRWEQTDDEPSRYVMTEQATCEARPFSFCASCPSKEELQEDFSTDKTKEGWYARWLRLKRED